MSNFSPTAETNAHARSTSRSCRKKRGGKRVAFVENSAPASVSQDANGHVYQQGSTDQISRPLWHQTQCNPAPAAAPNHNTMVVLHVKMYCPGCAKEVEKSLSRFNGVTDVQVDLQNERVTVMGAAIEPEKLRESILRRTGKKCEILSASVMEEQKNEQSGEEVKSLQHSETVQTTMNEEVKVIDQPKQQVQDYEKMVEMDELHNQIKKYLQYIACNRRAAVPQMEYEELLEGEHGVMEPQTIFSDENPNACSIQ